MRPALAFLSLPRRSAVDGLDRLSGKAKRHQHLAAAKRGVQYQMQYRRRFGEYIANRLRDLVCIWSRAGSAAYYANLRDCTRRRNCNSLSP